MKSKQRKVLEKSGIVVIIILFVTFVLTLLLKYNVEGEEEIPYKINKMVVVSAVNGTSTITEENKISTNIYQNNDIYFELERNNNYKSSENIKSVKITNIQIIGNENVKAYKPSASSTEGKHFVYTDENKIENEIEYKIANKGNINNCEITTEGGIIGISFCNLNMGTYTETEDKLSYNGPLLTKIGKTEQDINVTVKFNLIIETEKGKKYKAEITLNLPNEDFMQNEGESIKTDTELKNIVFKRTN